MAETEANLIQGKTPKAARAETVGTSNVNANADGFAIPIPKSQKILPDYIDPQTRMIKGLSPQSGETVSINLGVLQKQYGKDAGLERYTRIAKAGGFYDPNSEPIGSSFFPDLQLEGMDAEHRTAVNEILNEKE